jgi:hypothetical protein
MSDITNSAATTRVLDALGEQLAAIGERYELVLVGGSALLALELIERSTRDVDVVALRRGDVLESSDPLPAPLASARDRVARDFSLAPDWLNSGPTSILDLGLPKGFTDRLERREHGPALTVFLASRLDQIHLKLYALVDQGPGKHEADLAALDPSRSELLAAARWARTQDVSAEFAGLLVEVLAHLGVDDVDLDA